MCEWLGSHSRNVATLVSGHWIIGWRLSRLGCVSSNEAQDRVKSRRAVDDWGPVTPDSYQTGKALGRA